LVVRTETEIDGKKKFPAVDDAGGCHEAAVA
jgi:hypothetical protein